MNDSSNCPWQPPPEGAASVQDVWLIPQDIYDELMALPPGTDVTGYFIFEPGWNLTVTVAGEKEE